MDREWKERILTTSKRETEEEELEFIRLVHTANGNCDLDTVRVLMKTFSEKDDFGTQECVRSALASASKQDYVLGVLEELPRLVRETPDWAMVCLWREVHDRHEMVLNIANTMPFEVVVSLRQLLLDPDFQEDNPDWRVVEKGLRSSN